MDLATGVRDRGLGSEQAFLRNPVIISEERVFLAGTSRVIALNLHTGDELWRARDARPLAAAPGRDLYTQSGSGIERRDGTTGDRVLVAALDGRLADQSVVVLAVPDA